MIVFIAIFILTLILLLELRRNLIRQLKRKNSQHVKETLYCPKKPILNQLEDLKKSWKYQVGTIDSAQKLVVLLRSLKKYDEALQFVSRALKIYHSSPLLWIEKAHLLKEQGEWARAFNIYSHWKSSLSDSDLLACLQTLYQRAQYVQALDFVKSFLSRIEQKELLSLIGDCCFYEKQYQQAEELYQKAIAKGWINHRIFIRVAISLKALKQHKKAGYYFRQILEEDPLDVQATLGLGSCLELQGFYERALHIYRGSKLWKGQEASLVRQAGICSVRLQKYEEGEYYLKSAYSLGQRQSNVMAFIGFSLERQQKWGEAEHWYEQLVKAYPEHAAGYRALAWLFGVGRSSVLSVEQGLEVAKKALEKLPDTISWELLSACEARAGNFTKAHAIQQELAEKLQDQNSQQRCQKAMHCLSQQIPLNEELVSRISVA